MIENIQVQTLNPHLNIVSVVPPPPSRLNGSDH